MAFDDHAGQRRAQRVDLVDVAADAVQAAARERALALGARPRQLGLGGLQLAGRRDARLVQLLHARVALGGHPVVGLGAPRLGLGLADLGRSDLRQRLAGLHRVAGRGEDAHQPSGHRHVDARAARLVPGEPPLDADRFGLLGTDLDGAQRRHLLAAHRKADLLAFDDGLGGGRSGTLVGAARGEEPRQEQRRAAAAEVRERRQGWHGDGGRNAVDRPA